MDASHPDYGRLQKIRLGLFAQVGGESLLIARLPTLVREAIEYVIDPVRTARTTVAELGKEEKIFIATKMEHFLRDFLDVPKGIRDLIINGVDVDVTNTVGATWMIPRETFRHGDPVLLSLIADAKGVCSLGLMLARRKYLTKRKNNDKKRQVSALGKKNILWIAHQIPIPTSHWEGLDMARFRQLRNEPSGIKRAAAFFEENIGRKINRSVLQSLLWDQKDPMKRLRKNGGARDLLRPKGIELLSGQYDLPAAIAHLAAPLAVDEFIAIAVG